MTVTPPSDHESRRHGGLSTDDGRAVDDGMSAITMLITYAVFTIAAIVDLLLPTPFVPRWVAWTMLALVGLSIPTEIGPLRRFLRLLKNEQR